MTGTYKRVIPAKEKPLEEKRKEVEEKTVKVSIITSKKLKIMDCPWGGSTRQEARRSCNRYGVMAY